MADKETMGTFKTVSLEAIALQNVSLGQDGFDPVLAHVDFEMPIDQTILVESSNPFHAVQFLQILAGQQRPQSGCVKWNEKDIYSDEESHDFLLHEMIGCYFENQRPNPNLTVKEIWSQAGIKLERQTDLLEQFEIEAMQNLKFRNLTFELQKTIQLIGVIAKEPQMLILEDPASGLSETLFLEILDLIQYGQRRGQLRHIYLTNNHPTAERHLGATSMHIEDGLLYLEEKFDAKKVFNF